MIKCIDLVLLLSKPLTLSNSKWFSTLDCGKDYRQVEIRDKDKESQHFQRLVDLTIYCDNIWFK